MKDLHFNYVDGIILIVLVIGIVRGRKRGMSEELLTFVQWLVIIFGGSKIYGPLGKMLSEQAPFSLATSYVIVYLLFALLVKGLFSQIQRALGEKVVGSNFFGGSEYYLGMLAGMIRFACVLLMLMAVLNARLVTDRERAETARMQRKNFEDISFPTYGSVQYSVLNESFTGKQVKEHLEFLLIRSTVAKDVALRRNDGGILNDVMK